MNKLNDILNRMGKGIPFFVAVRILCLIFIISGSASFAQMLDNSDGNAFSSDPFFNSDFIKRNEIRRAYGAYMIRKPGKSFKNTSYYQVFEFSKEGELTMQSETYPGDGTSDTTLTEYSYNDEHQLIGVRKKSTEGFIKINYERDSAGRVTRRTVLKEFFDTASKDTLLTEINEETFVYNQFDNKLIKTSYNSYGLPYLDEVFYYDDDGYLLKKTERIRTTSTYYIIDYSYNEKGMLSSIRKSDAKSNSVLEELLFVYDDFGNLTEKQTYRNGKHTTETQIIYSNKTGLLSSVITKTIATDVLTILRFKDFEYYD